MNPTTPNAPETELDILLRIDLVDIVKALEKKIDRYREPIVFLCLLCPAEGGHRQVQLASNMSVTEIEALLLESVPQLPLHQKEKPHEQ
jgi:hypothetical protein